MNLAYRYQSANEEAGGLLPKQVDRDKEALLDESTRGVTDAGTAFGNASAEAVKGMERL